MSATSTLETTCQLLRKSTLFCTYQDAFRCATGLPLMLVDADSHLRSGTLPGCLPDQINTSPFCRELNICRTACNACLEVNRKLTEYARIHGPSTCQCFSGMVSSALPIRCHGQIVGYLRTGHVFQATPPPGRFDKVARTLRRHGLSASETAALATAYQQTRVVEPQRYQSMLTLLATFALQLGRHGEKLLLQSTHSEPHTITRAKAYIEEHLGEALTLPMVARHVGVSDSHFCRLFKEATGLTLTDYLNRRRVEWAKRELLKPQTRVSEIAFQIGYQSLSQFNRSFARLTGCSPSQFRRSELATAI